MLPSVNKPPELQEVGAALVFVGSDSDDEDFDNPPVEDLALMYPTIRRVYYHTK